MQTLDADIINFGARLRKERERLGHTQESFGASGGVTRLTQSKYEKGESSPTMGYMIGIEGIGADFNYIMTGNFANYKNSEDVHNEHASLAAAVVEELEKAIISRGAFFSPEKKARLVATIYRNSRHNFPVDKRLISDLLDLALE